MHIVDLLKIEYIVSELSAGTKPEVLREIAAALALHDSDINADAMCDVLMAREKLGSTGIGDGIAIPHGKMQALKEPMIAFARSRRGISFDALDGRPAHLFFVVVVPEKTTGVHFRLLARLSRMLKDKAFRDQLLKADTVHEVLETIRLKEQSLQA